MNRIIFLIPSLQPGGMERVMSELIAEFSSKYKVELHLILYGIKREVFYKIPKSVQIYNPAFKFNNRYRFWYSLKTLIYLRKTINQLNPSAILSFGEIWNNFVLLALIDNKKYSIYVSDRCQPNKSLGIIHDHLRIHLYQKASGIIAQTEKAKQIYKQKFQHSNIKVIENPIALVSNNKHIKRENIVLTVGRLINTKHHDELIRLFLSLNRHNWKLIIVGDDAQKQQNMIRLKRLIKEFNAEERVILTGRRSDVEHFYLKSKIFAFTSSSEGFPNVIGEAMSAELPVVTFDCIAGPSDMVIDKRNGYLIDLFDYKTFQTRLKQLMDNEQLRIELGKQAREDIKKFKKEIIAEKYYQFITSHI